MGWGKYTNEELGINRNITCSMFTGKGVSIEPAKDVECATKAELEKDLLIDFIRLNTHPETAKGASLEDVVWQRYAGWRTGYKFDGCRSNLTPLNPERFMKRVLETDSPNNGFGYMTAKTIGERRGVSPQDVTDAMKNVYQQYAAVCKKLMPQIISRFKKDFPQQADKKMSNEIEGLDAQCANDFDALLKSIAERMVKDNPGVKGRTFKDVCYSFARELVKARKGRMPGNWAFSPEDETSVLGVRETMRGMKRDGLLKDLTREDLSRVIALAVKYSKEALDKIEKSRKMSNDIDENDEQKATDTTCSNLTDEIKDLDSWCCDVLWYNYRHKADSIQEYIDDLAYAHIENARTMGKKITTRELQSLIQKQVHGLIKKGASFDTDLQKIFRHYDKLIAQRCQRAKSKNKDIVMANDIDLQRSRQISNEIDAKDIACATMPRFAKILTSPASIDKLKGMLEYANMLNEQNREHVENDSAGDFRWYIKSLNHNIKRAQDTFEQIDYSNDPNLKKQCEKLFKQVSSVLTKVRDTAIKTRNAASAKKGTTRTRK